jgi:Flp pilus assembly protein TadG
MKRPSRFSTVLRSEKGAVLVVVAVLMVIFMGFAALVVDLGNLFVTRNQLQNVSDGSALAGTRVLGNIYQGLPYSEQVGFECDEDCVTKIQTAALDVAGNNWAAGAIMNVRVEDVLIGQWDGAAFTETLTNPDAVHVVARRDTLANGPVATFFARAIGVDESAVTASATAALSGKGTTEEGEVELPIGISKWHFEKFPNDGFCKTHIQFSPTNDPSSCGGWHTFTYDPPNDDLLRTIALGEDDRFSGPATVAFDTEFKFVGGKLSTHTFGNLLTRFQREGWDTDANGNYLLLNPNGPDEPYNRIKQATLAQGAVPLYELGEDGEVVIDSGTGLKVQALYPDGTPRNMHKWKTTLPVYERADCSNPNESLLIVGFADIEMTDVWGPPSKLVRGTIMCDSYDNDLSRGGGGEYGVKGSIPGLVR